jgi:shikimate dehydrogenase
MLIDKNTNIYCSFSFNPGNNGCKFFNHKFKENNINAIYKSFYSNDIEKSVEAVKTLNIKGFAVSMPFKSKIISYVDEISPEVKDIGAANTVTNTNGYLKAYNTDWVGVYNYLQPYHYDFIYILGNGGFSKAIQFALGKLNISFYIIDRKEWDKIPELKGVIFNATPVEVITKETLIDGRPFTEQGKQISLLQALEQYKIYINEY